MDKRTLIFVVSLTLALFAANIFFTYQDQEKNQQWIQQQQAKKTQQLQKLTADIKERTAKPEDLPLVELYRDKEGKEYLSSGVAPCPWVCGRSALNHSK